MDHWQGNDVQQRNGGIRLFRDVQGEAECIDALFRKIDGYQDLVHLAAILVSPNVGSGSAFFFEDRHCKT